MKSKELLENVIIDCEYYGKDKAIIDKETIENIKNTNMGERLSR